MTQKQADSEDRQSSETTASGARTNVPTSPNGATTIGRGMSMGMAGASSQMSQGSRAAGGQAMEMLPPPPTLDELLSTIPKGDAGKVIAEPEDESAKFFNEKRVHDVDISLTAEDLALIDSDPSAEMYVNADVKLDGESLGTVGLRYKGSAGAFIAPCTAAMYPGEMRGAKVGKCSMKLDFDRVNADLRFHGLKKINLHAMGRDPSMLREMFGYALFREMGIATPRTTYARVVVNGELEGLFLAVEQVDGRFTRARFTEGGKGNVYKEAWPNTLDPGRYLAALETNEDEDDVNVMSMLAFATAVQLEPKAALNWLDREYMLNYIAVDRMILNDDGAFRFYCTVLFGRDFGGGRNHNFYWYESPIGTRLWLMPWDLDLSFAGALRTRVDRDWRDASVCDCHLAEGVERASRQRAPACDPLFGEVANWLDDYDQAVDKFIEGPFAAKAVEGKLMRWIDLIQPNVKESAGINSAPSESEWQDAIATLRMVIDHTRETRGHWPGF